MSLPKDAAARKAVPVATGFFYYFPDAICAVAELSRIGNDQHNPGSPLHWDRSKSGDELDALSRHLLESGTIDTDGVRHSVKLAWRAMANLQKELESCQADTIWNTRKRIKSNLGSSKSERSATKRATSSRKQGKSTKATGLISTIGIPSRRAARMLRRTGESDRSTPTAAKATKTRIRKHGPYKPTPGGLLDLAIRDARGES